MNDEEKKEFQEMFDLTADMTMKMMERFYTPKFMQIMAKGTRIQYDELVKAGFTEEQSLKLVMRNQEVFEKAVTQGSKK